MVLAVAIIVIISIQQGKTDGLNALGSSGQADSFFGKNKGRTKDAVLSKLTIVLSVLLVVVVIALNIAILV